MTLLVAGCTPIGGWIYDDPDFVLSELTVRNSGNPSDTLEMVLTACNRNDFPIQATGLNVSLEVQGTPLGSARTTAPVTLGTRDSTKLTVPIPLPPGSREGNGRITFVMTGFSTLETPIGVRRVEIFQKGAVALKPNDVVAHIDRAGRPCRPGRSTLPGYMPSPRVMPPMEPIPPTPMPTNQPQ